MEDYRACDFACVPPHPLIYASLEPRYSPSLVSRIDLHKPKVEYTVGRGPLNDFVLENERTGQIDWLHCTLTFNASRHVHIVDNHTTNGIWVNNRRLDPGESCLLNDGDSVRFGMCVRSHCKWPHVDEGYIPGFEWSYVFRSFVERAPPGLSSSDEELRVKLQALERTKADTEAERARLEQKLKDINKETVEIIKAMPPVPPTKPVDSVIYAQKSYEIWAEPLREHYPDFFPEDVRDFAPQPWLPPKGERKGDIALYEMHRSFGALPNKRPPPLERDSPVRHFTRALHLEDAPNWNDPEVRWDGLQALNISTPLNVPPSIIFWSMEHQLPVYMHPNFVEASRKGPYAHPFAISENLFSDESAADYRVKLGLPPLKSAQPLRPYDALSYRIKTHRTIPDEQELAEWVAILHGSCASPPAFPSEPFSLETEGVPTPSASTSSCPRVGGVDSHTATHGVLEDRTSSPPASADGVCASSNSTARERVSSRSSSPFDPAETTPHPSSSNPSTSEDLVRRKHAATPPLKRRKTYHSPSPRPTAPSVPPGAPTDEADIVLHKPLNAFSEGFISSTSKL